MSGSSDISEILNSGRAPEVKSSFTQTCNRLSQCLKEKRNLGLEIASKLEAARGTIKPAETTQYQLMDLFPRKHAREPATVEAECNKTGQMTIFYGEQVFVFDSFPAEKAVELMLFAVGGESGPNSGAAKKIKSGDSLAFGAHALPNQIAQEHLQPPTQPTGSDLPIARRASLHRFLDKRKDRFISRAAPYPYQVHGGPSTSSPRKEEHLDLKL